MRPKKFRVRTMKSTRLGVISQGLAMSIDILPIHERTIIREDWFINGINVIGQDVTELLGVQKYEIPIEGGKNTKPKGMFPTYIVPKTDELRIQAFPKLLEEMKGLPYVMRIKMDGTSCSIYSFNGESGVCSRNLELHETDGDVYWKIAHNNNLPQKLQDYCKTIGKNLAIQGEICGPIVIRGGRNPLNSRVDELFLFSVYDIDRHMYVDDIVAEGIAADLGIRFVELKEKGDNFNFTIEELLEKVKNVYYLSTKNQIEGLVIRPQKSTYSPTIGGQLSFKIISPDYLLEED